MGKWSNSMRLCVPAIFLGLAGCAALPPGTTGANARLEVMATERAFAKTMADRDHAAFASFIADEAVFFSGPTPLHGKAQVVASWARFYANAKAPFSWDPDEVEVLESGTLAISSGPVRNPEGKVIARFTSVWRRTAANRWEIVFDKGNDVCNCTTQ
jgi:ketosteroid isomerase-like protein